MYKMITEDYVSYETAKLLKEKGFDSDECEVHYNPEDHTQYDITIQMATKWLRKNFNLNPFPYALSLGWAFDVFNLSDRDITGCKKLYSMDFSTKSACYETYEEACEAAIKYCLENLI